jgi:bifunctional non-homologous end joining protein LigD
MKALPVEKLPEGDWLYEIKHDGYRALAFKDGKDVRLISRNNKPLNYPQVLDSLKLLSFWPPPTIKWEAREPKGK